LAIFPRQPPAIGHLLHTLLDERYDFLYETLGKESIVKMEDYGDNWKIKGKSSVNHLIDVLTNYSVGVHI